MEFSILTITIVSLTLIVLAIVLNRIRINANLTKLEKAKNKTFVESLNFEIQRLNLEFSDLLTFDNGYLNNYKLNNWKLSATEICNSIAKLNLEQLKLENSILKEADKLIYNYSNYIEIKDKYNLNFINNELKTYNNFFSNIEGQSLDEQQRKAIVKDEDNNLVIAGAGSGKTTTVAGKVAYVIDRFKVKPEEILLITFTKKASDEMKFRIKQKMNIEIEVNTFHSFGRKVIGEATNNMPTVIEEMEFYKIMRTIFKKLFEKNSFSNAVIKFITEYRLDSKDENEFKSHGEYISYIKDNNIKSYKKIEKTINGRQTFLRETCKSLEEVKIANFLFLNGINYIYENPYQYGTANNTHAQYKPDFYLTDYDIYIEHFALIDRKKNVPNWFSSSDYLSPKEKYNSDIEWKRKTHSVYNTILVETFSYENKEGVLLENLKSKLESKKVVFEHKTNDEIWQILSSIADDEVSALETLIFTFLNLFKSNNSNIDKLNEKIISQENYNIKTRYLLFMEIFTPLLNEYNNHLKANNLIDFSDMINDATKYINEQDFKKKYKYIIIDEFQDTSIGRFNLINALLKNNRSCKLFAVGDDWQSIYRFAGSDISLFTQFEKYFGVTEFSKIETTYRFSKSMIDISSKFILTNPNQTNKDLKPFVDDSSISPIEIIYSNSYKNDDPGPFISALKKIDLETKDLNKKIKILALARYNNVIKIYKERKDLFTVNFNEVNSSYIIKYHELPYLDVEFLSVHRSKGLQSDYVILLHCVSGQYGFPSEQADDPILNLLLSKSDQFENGEERRLFYVALTRAKRKTFITTNINNKSKFINEINPILNENSVEKCSFCKTGDIITKEGIDRNGLPYSITFCSNWNYDCEFPTVND